MEKSQQKMISRVLMNITGYPVPDINIRREAFRGRLDWCDNLDDKLDKFQDLKLDNFNPAPEEQWIILEALKFVLKEYDDDDFSSVMDGTREDYSKLYALLDTQWSQTLREPSEDYRVNENIY